MTGRRTSGVALVLAALGALSVVPADHAHVPAAALVGIVPDDAGVRAASVPVPLVDQEAVAAAPRPLPPSERLARQMVGPQVPSRDALPEALARLGAVSLLAGGPGVTGDTLVDVAADLDLTVAGPSLDVPAWEAAVRAAAATARPLLVAAGLDAPAIVRVQDLAAALTAFGIDHGRVVDGPDVEALRAAVRADLAEIGRAAGLDADPATPDGLGQLLSAIGVDYGTRVDPDDVAQARSQAASLLLAAEQAAAAAAEAAAAAAAEAAAATVAPLREPAPAPAPDPAPAAPSWREVHGSLVHRTFALPGPVSVQVLRWRLDDPALELRADYAAGPGRRGTVPEAAARTGAVAAINGGFWVGENDPDGLLVRDGFLLSDSTANTDGHRNIRSAFGVRGGQGVVGVPRWNGYVDIAGARLGVHGVNRPPHGPGEVLLIGPGTGADPVGDRPGTALRVPRVDLTVAGVHELPVLERRDGGTLPVTGESMIVWVSPEAMAVPGGIRHVTVRVTMAPEWEGMDTALAAGPWLLTRGEGVGVQQWRYEGFDAAHTDGRHPRSAIGFTGDGHGVIVAVDGRRPGRSEGMSHTEVARFLQGLGVTDAVMLDGGGSSQMVVGGQLANTPCCDQSLRRVSTVVTLRPR